MSIPLPAHLLGSVRIAWHISSWCNYSCSYCPVLVYRKRARGGPPQDHAFDHYPVEQWLALFRRFPQTDVHLKITGGEPFLDRENFKATLRGLSEMQQFTLRIDSNGSWDPSYFQDLDKSRTFLNIAFHPHEVDFDTFFKRIRRLRDAGWDVEMLNFVLAPESLDTFQRHLAQVERAGFFVNLSPMNPTGAYQSRTERSPRELAIIERYNMPIDIAYKVGNPKTKGRFCFHPALSYYLMFDGRIQVFCTDRFQNAFTDGIPPLPRQAVPCPYDHCIGCTEMYRALADEPLNSTPLSLYPVDEYRREVLAYRRRHRRLTCLRRFPFANKLLPPPFHVEPARPDPPALNLLSADAIKPPLPPQPLFGALEANGVPSRQTALAPAPPGPLQARGGDRLALSGWAASRSHGAPVKEVRLTLDGRPLGLVRDFHYRPDIAASFQRAELAQCGWRTMVFLPQLPRGAYRLAASAVAPGGETAPIGALELTIVD